MIVEVKELTVSYEGFIALENITFSVEKPAFIGIVGPNGAGKSTLLKSLLGIVKPLKGSIRVLGMDPVKEPYRVRKQIGYLPQRDFIDRDIPIKVKDVILLGLLAKRTPPRVVTARDLERVREALKLVDLEGMMDKRFDELSGGQQQRVLLARALISEPKLLLLDEPLAATDVRSRVVILNVLRNLVDKKGITVIMVTHDINIAMEYCDYVALLNRKLIAYGKVSEVLTPENLLEAYGLGARVYTTSNGKLLYIADYHICDFCEYWRAREWRKRHVT